MTDLITTGTLTETMPQRETLVADAITTYLEREHKTINETVLNEMTAAFAKSMTRQIMSPRMNRTGYESTTCYTGSCARKARLQYDGVKGEPVQARSLLKFILGDMVELAVIGIAQLAGVDISMNNANLHVIGRDGVKVNVHPDGLIKAGDEYYNFECKSCDSRTFDKWLEQGGPDDSWGYRTQTSIEDIAWQLQGYVIKGTCFVAVSTGSRQGSIAEWILPYDQALVDGWHARRALARAEKIPDIPFGLEPETDYVAGKAAQAEWLAQGATPRVNTKGTVYGWDVPTGRKILPMLCSYCQYKGTCYPTAQMEVKGGKPVWVQPKEMP